MCVCVCVCVCVYVCLCVCVCVSNIFFSPEPKAHNVSLYLFIITDRPKAVLSLRFYLFNVRYRQFLNVLILTLLCVQFI